MSVGFGVQANYYTPIEKNKSLTMMSSQQCNLISACRLWLKMDLFWIAGTILIAVLGYNLLPWICQQLGLYWVRRREYMEEVRYVCLWHDILAVCSYSSLVNVNRYVLVLLFSDRPLDILTKSFSVSVADFEKRFQYACILKYVQGAAA